MQWDAWYGPEQSPDLEEIAAFVGNGLWEKARSGLETGFHTAPRLNYSSCSMQKGWNVKYKTGGRALCTLYPMAGYFLALIVIGQREEKGTAALLESLGEGTRQLYHHTAPAMGARWLMLKIDTEEALEDLMLLVKLRAAS